MTIPTEVREALERCDEFASWKLYGIRLPDKDTSSFVPVSQKDWRTLRAYIESTAKGEPVAWMRPGHYRCGDRHHVTVEQLFPDDKPLYAAPPAPLTPCPTCGFSHGEYLRHDAAPPAQPTGPDFDAMRTQLAAVIETELRSMGDRIRGLSWFSSDAPAQPTGDKGAAEIVDWLREVAACPPNRNLVADLIERLTRELAESEQRATWWVQQYGIERDAREQAERELAQAEAFATEARQLAMGDTHGSLKQAIQGLKDRAEQAERERDALTYKPSPDDGR